MRHPISTAALAGALLVAGSGLCTAQTVYDARQSPPTSHYPDGTGNLAVDSLNAGQLDQNYRGPWHQVPASRVRPGYGAPVYGTPVYAPPAYPSAAYAPGRYAQPVYPPPGY